MTEISLYSNKISSCTISNTSKLSTLDLHDNSLGSGSLKIGSYSYSASNGNMNVSNKTGINWDIRGGFPLTDIKLYGNSICYYRSDYDNNSNNSGITSITTIGSIYYLADLIPADSIILEASMTFWDDGWGYTSSDYNFQIGSWGKSQSLGAAWGGSASSSWSIKRSDITESAGLKNVKMRCKRYDTASNSMTTYFYPFGK